MSHESNRRPGSNGTHAPIDEPLPPDPQVIPKAERRRFSAEYKQSILAEADTCSERGQIGALLRREGLYSSHLDKWRKQRQRAVLQGLAPHKRGPKPDPQAAEISQLRRENEQLRARLQRAEQIIDVQKKLAELLGMPAPESPSRAEPSSPTPKC